MISRFPPVAWVSDVRARVLAAADRPCLLGLRRARGELDRRALEDVLCDVFERIRGNVLTEEPARDGIRSHEGAAWPDEARLASTGEGLLARSVGGGAVALDLECGQRTVLHVELLEAGADLVFELRAAERWRQDAPVSSIEAALDAALAAQRVGPRGARAGDVRAHRRRRSVSTMVDDLPRELVTQPARFDASRIEEALVAIVDEASAWPLPRVRTSAPSQLEGDDHGVVNGLGHGFVRHDWADGRATLWVTLDDTRSATVHVPAPDRDEPSRVTVRATTGRALAQLSDRFVRAFAAIGVRLEPQVGPVQRMRERAWDCIYDEPVRTLHLAWSSDLDRERMTATLTRLYATIVPSQPRLEEIRDGREALGSTGVEDVAYSDGRDHGLVVLSRAFGSYPGDATETIFFLLLPDGATVATKTMDQCSMSSVPYVLRGPLDTVDALERALLAVE